MNSRGRPYDKIEFAWAIMYKANARCRPHVCYFYTSGLEARREANLLNRKDSILSGKWSVKRFRFYYRGSEIDAYEHDFERREKVRK